MDLHPGLLSGQPLPVPRHPASGRSGVCRGRAGYGHPAGRSFLDLLQVPRGPGPSELGPGVHRNHGLHRGRVADHRAGRCPLQRFQHLGEQSPRQRVKMKDDGYLSPVFLFLAFCCSCVFPLRMCTSCSLAFKARVTVGDSGLCFGVRMTPLALFLGFVIVNMFSFIRMYLCFGLISYI